MLFRSKYRADRQGFLEDGLRQLFTVPADGGTPRQITTGEWAANGTTWMPDGKSLVFTSLRTKDAEYAWRESEIYAVDVASGRINQLTRRKGPDNNPVPSPDGKRIARAEVNGAAALPEALGQEIARALQSQDADAILAACRVE